MCRRALFNLTMPTSPRRNSIATTDNVIGRNKSRKRPHSLGGPGALQELKEHTNPAKGILKSYSSFSVDPAFTGDEDFNDIHTQINNTVIGISSNVMAASKRLQMEDLQQLSRETSRKSLNRRVSFASHARVRWYPKDHQSDSEKSTSNHSTPERTFASDAKNHSPKGPTTTSFSRNETQSSPHSHSASIISDGSDMDIASPIRSTESDMVSEALNAGHPPPSLYPENDDLSIQNPTKALPEAEKALDVHDATREQVNDREETNMDLTIQFQEADSFLSHSESIKGLSSSEQGTVYSLKASHDPSNQTQLSSPNKSSSPTSIEISDFSKNNENHDQSENKEEEEDMMLTRPIEIPQHFSPIARPLTSQEAIVDMDITSNNINLSPVSHFSNGLDLQNLEEAPMNLTRPINANPHLTNHSPNDLTNGEEEMDTTSAFNIENSHLTLLSPIRPSSRSMEEQIMDLTQPISSTNAPTHLNEDDLNQFTSNISSSSKPRKDNNKTANSSKPIPDSEDFMDITRPFNILSPSKEALSEEQPMELTSTVFPCENSTSHLEVEEAAMDETVAFQIRGNNVELPSADKENAEREEIPSYSDKSENFNTTSFTNHERSPNGNNNLKFSKDPNSSSPSRHVVATPTDKLGTRKRRLRYSTSSFDQSTLRRNRLATIRNARKSISTLNDRELLPVNFFEKKVNSGLYKSVERSENYRLGATPLTAEKPFTTEKPLSSLPEEVSRQPTDDKGEQVSNADVDSGLSKTERLTIQQTNEIKHVPTNTTSSVKLPQQPSNEDEKERITTADYADSTSLERLESQEPNRNELVQVGSSNAGNTTSVGMNEHEKSPVKLSKGVSNVDTSLGASTINTNILNQDSGPNEEIPVGNEPEFDTMPTLPNVEPISLSDFLKMTGIEFLDNLTIAKRRETLLPNAEENKKCSIQELLESFYIQFPLLELYKFSCQQLQDYIAEGKDFVTKIEEETLKENPLLFYEYRKASSDMRVLMDSQFLMMKTFARLQAKGDWYEWREGLMQGIKHELNLNLTGMQRSLTHLMDVANVIHPYAQEIQERYNGSITTVQTLKKQKEFANQYDSTLLAQAQEKLEKLKVEVERRRRLLSEKEERRKELAIKIEQVTNSCSDLELRTNAEQDFYAKNQDFEFDEIKRYEEQLLNLKNELGWTIVSLTAGGIKLATNNTALSPYSAEVTVEILRQNFQVNVDIACKFPNESNACSSNVLEHVASSFSKWHSKVFSRNLRLLKKYLNDVSICWEQIVYLVQDFQRLWYHWPFLSVENDDKSIIINVELYLRSVSSKVKVVFGLPIDTIYQTTEVGKFYASTSVAVKQMYAESEGDSYVSEVLNTLSEVVHCTSTYALSSACLTVWNKYS